jgi:phosphoserine aminotransferase
VQFKNFPSSNVPIAVDMSSDILSRPVDVNNFAVIYAGAQKNIGPAGLTVVIVRKDLCGNARDMTPTFLDYAQQADNDSMINTPPTYGWYLAGLVFKWIKAQGGVAAIDEHNQVKANLLYSAIENSNFYSSPVASANRSTMNVPFTLADSALDGEFVKQAEARGMFNLKGHRSVGGMRASIYNAVSLEAVQALVSFMSEFENERG